MCCWYIPLDLAIRLNPNIKDGIKHFFYAIQLGRNVFEKNLFWAKDYMKKSGKKPYQTSEWDIFKPEMLINSHYCTSEWILYTPIIENDKFKTKALNIINKGSFAIFY